ncbi:o-succinylbenzoate--CoA ligase [Halopelagius longus]|uniref:2-succinylbenzoate--CoA ligase n=1 Tax=Halopelagius longus TaxID=1236180 RepID=A0A1H1B1W7_9EURY|nr:o-succinylbenzoate--CoA ligase [Halopelagius longus]RDI70592.1 o-succinylbenzoate--CoA ligase [Halopelagius longus]SDQ45446.1 O-succinylbenzoic acid--CoA ligase [Halopelagius longus]
MRDWLSHRVRASPDATALILASTGESWTFAELDSMVEETAARLAALGVESGDHLGVVMETRVAYVRLLHAAMRLGVTLVPMGDGLTAGELRSQAETADVTAVVCGSATEGRAVEAAGEAPVVSVDPPATDEVSALEDASPESFEPASWELDDAQLLLFTSGTTGDPKAVTLTTLNLLSSAVASAFRLGFDPADRWLVALSLHHMGGIAPVLRMPLYGMTVVLRPEFRAGPTADDIERHEVTAVSLVPTMLRRMLEKRGTLSESLRVVLLGGAPASAELIERCRNYSVPVYPTYGMTETASQIATARPKEAFRNVGTVGRPLYWTDLTVVDESGAPVERGETGELVVSGPTVTPGYYGDEAATTEAFCEYGLKTGDAGYLDAEGRLYVLNRVDDRIITGGENVEPGEVVDVLRSHPDVRDAAVVGVPDPEWGERVGALVVRDSEELTRDGVEEYARERLAGFKLPRIVAFADELPRTVSGTVKRDAVRERLEAVAEDEDEETDEPDDETANGESEDEDEAPEGDESDDEPTDESDDGDEESDDGDEDYEVRDEESDDSPDGDAPADATE